MARVRVEADGLTVRVTAGTHVALVAMDATPELATGLLGFAIERTDHTEGERYWLRNWLRFAGDDRSGGSDRHPFQSFLWGDYTAKPDHAYTYRVVALRGQPGRVQPAAEASAAVATESEVAGDHAVFFNRGAVASPFYVERFGSRHPRDVANGEAYRWLSRGLREALVGFVGEASGPEWGLRGAFYEFEHEPVLAALRIAADSGADVQLVVDARNRASAPQPREDNLAAIEATGLGPWVRLRERSPYLSHNKFLVLTRRGAAVAVWTGSTNITEGGIFGHSNVGHLVRIPAVARRYLAYWDQLAADPATGPLKAWTEDATAIPARLPRRGSITTVFSPRSSLEALEWYARLMGGARSSVFLTGAFGVSEQLRGVLFEDRPYLRYVLLDSDRDDVSLLIRDADPDNRVTVGSAIGTGGFRQWVEERLPDLNGHVRFVHTKILLVDPLGDDPVVVTGSANFSEASTNRNDENMLVIRGDTRVADIYLTELMRVFKHYEFRHRVAPRQRTARSRRGRATPASSRRHLVPDDSWVARWYEEDARRKERELFSAPL